MNNRGLLLVLSGPAGSGKGTVLAEVLKTGDFALSVSATTRAPRPGERDGVNYHYLSREEFLSRIAAGELLEYTEYCGNFYGTLKSETEAVLESGRNLILEIEVEGAMNVKRAFPDAITVMLLPPSFAVQEARLRGRGTETEEKILERLARTREEVPNVIHYDYVIYNRDGGAPEAAKDLLSVVRAERCATSRGGDIAARYFEESHGNTATSRAHRTERIGIE